MMPEMRSRTVPIKEIAIGERHRKDLGDLGPLADSIRDVGLLHPPVITTSNELVCGLRRIEAAWSLGWQEIDVRVIDPDDILIAEVDENEVRKGFTVTERVAIGKAIEARIGSRQGQRTDRMGATEKLRQKITEVGDEARDEKLRQKITEVEPGARTKDVAARKAGFGNRETYRQASEVVDKGDPETVEAMDKGEISVKAAHDRIKPPAKKPKAGPVGPGKTLVNGVPAEDPPEIAKARANGRIAADAVVEITEPGSDDGTSGDAPAVSQPDDAQSDEQWLGSLPVRARLGANARVLFDRDALAYRQASAARKAFAMAVRSTLKAADRRGPLPSYLHRLRAFLKIDEPKHWTACPAPEHGGCGGTGEAGLIGRCPKCHGGGYLI